MCGMACVKHSTFWFTTVSFLLAVYSPPGGPLEKSELGLVPVSPSVSVALVSMLATVSVHSRLCRVGLHTCYSVSPQRPQVSQSPLNESIGNGYRLHVHISFHRGWTGILRWTRVSSHYNDFLSGLAVRIECDRARVVFCLNWAYLSTRGGGGTSHVTSLRLVD